MIWVHVRATDTGGCVQVACGCKVYVAQCKYTAIWDLLRDSCQEEDNYITTGQWFFSQDPSDAALIFK